MTDINREEVCQVLDNISEKLDDVKAEIAEIKKENREDHKDFAAKIEKIEKTCIAREFIVEATQKHLEADKSFEDSWNQKLARVLIFAAASAASAIIGALVVRLWP